MTRGYTTIEQSKHLAELGLDPSTADMCYSPEDLEYQDKYTALPRVIGFKLLPGEFPCWSLTALLELMPVCINDDNYFLVIEKDATYLDEPIWRVSYEHFIKEDKNVERCASLINAAFEMVCWLIEQGHIKVNK